MGKEIEHETNIWTAASDGNIEKVKEWLERIAVDSQDEQVVFFNRDIPACTQQRHTGILT